MPVFSPRQSIAMASGAAKAVQDVLTIGKAVTAAFCRARGYDRLSHLIVVDQDAQSTRRDSHTAPAALKSARGTAARSPAWFPPLEASDAGPRRARHRHSSGRDPKLITQPDMASIIFASPGTLQLCGRSR